METKPKNFDYELWKKYTNIGGSIFGKKWQIRKTVLELGLIDSRIGYTITINYTIYCNNYIKELDCIETCIFERKLYIQICIRSIEICDLAFVYCKLWWCSYKTQALASTLSSFLKRPAMAVNHTI